MSGYTAKELLGAVLRPGKIVKHLGGKGYFKWIPDELYLRICFHGNFGKKLDLRNPKTYNEKIQWLKLHDRNPEHVIMADKYAVKQYVAERVGEEYVIPAYGVWNSFDEIDFSVLPSQFVLKCTHDSGGVVICKDKNAFDKERARKFLEKNLKRNFYYVGREWAYKDIPPRIVAEKYLEDNQTGELIDYKLMVCNGKVKGVFVCSGRQTKNGTTITYLDREWKVLPVEVWGHRRSETTPSKPASYDKMVELAEKLSDSTPYVRMDFYEVSGKPFFGEFTFYDGNGFDGFTPESFDYLFGSWIDLHIQDPKENK